jgi:hypothetical protein
LIVPEPRYFGIALTLDELHKILGLPEDVSIAAVRSQANSAPVGIVLRSDSEHYYGHPASYSSTLEAVPCVRPDIQTRTVSQVVIHPLREK